MGLYILRITRFFLKNMIIKYQSHLVAAFQIKMGKHVKFYQYFLYFVLSSGYLCISVIEYQCHRKYCCTDGYHYDDSIRGNGRHHCCRLQTEAQETKIYPLRNVRGRCVTHVDIRLLCLQYTNKIMYISN